MEEEANELIDPLYEIIDRNEELNEYQQGIMDVINWIYQGGDKPQVVED